MNTNNRRRFLSDTFSTVASFGVGAAFTGMGRQLALADGPIQSSSLQPALDETTGLPLLRLPQGFRYVSLGWTHDEMHDGSPTPPSHDGMGVIGVDGDVLTLCRNHELSDDGPALPFAGGQPFDPNSRAGCTMLKFDAAAGALSDSRVCFSGSSRNCAGGVTPWGTWLTCEETVLGPNDHDPYKDHARRSFEKDHGWIFEVPLDGEGKASGSPQPLHDMGRFVHEAVAVDRETSIVYETEDRGTAGFYRFIPHQPGNLSAGGRLEMAEVVGQPDLRGGIPNGSTFDVRWHRIDHPERAHSPGSAAKALNQWNKYLSSKASGPANNSATKKTFGLGDELGVYRQGKAKGASTFSRLEGCWYGNGLIYFDATNGGAAKAGQIWQYDPKAEQLTLLFESPNKPTLNMPDNLCVSPRGGIVLCEDNDYGANEYPHRVFTLTQDGELSLFAENNVRLKGEKNGFKGDFRSKEWAGATFSPDGQWLFINIQTPGITFAITGPWEDTFV
ncbi:MAG: alkaline phosphatase PhoX [Planctomycetota bacterium]